MYWSQVRILAGPPIHIMKLKTNSVEILKNNSIIIILFIFILLFHQIIFQKFFPNSDGLLGHDYEYFIPHLMFGKIWFTNNFLSVPWFSAAFCCGTPFYADPETMYYSINQFIFLIFDPISSIRTIFFFHAFVSFIGMFLLLNKNFNFNKYNSLLCSSLFLFNGFFIYRAIPGHLGHLSYIFVPLYCYILINSFKAQSKKQSLAYLIFSSIIFAHFFHSGAGPIMPIISVSILTILLFYIHFIKNFRILINLSISFVLGILISLSKISAVLIFLNNYPRNYPQLEFNSISSFVKTFFLSFFYKPNGKYFNENISSMFPLEIHEIEYGLSIVPIILLFFIFFLNKKNFRINLHNISFIILITSIFLIPILLNVDFLNQLQYVKQIPILKNHWVQVRWMVVYIIPIIIISGILIENINFSLKKKNFLIFVLGSILLLQNFARDKSWHLNDQRYSLDNTIEFSKTLKNGIKPKIFGPSVFYNRENKPANIPFRNDFLYFSYSPILCYSGVFGYGLGKLDATKILMNSKTVYPNGTSLLYSSAFDEKDGHYMFFNPSCFLFPKENNCSLADTFKTSEKGKLINFLNYKKFDFKISKVQLLANYISIFFFLVSFLYLVYYFFSFIIYFKNINIKK